MSTPSDKRNHYNFHSIQCIEYLVLCVLRIKVSGPVLVGPFNLNHVQGNTLIDYVVFFTDECLLRISVNETVCELLTLLLLH